MLPGDATRSLHGKADRHIRLLTIETESRLGAANEGPPVPEEQYQERLWRRRLDGIGLDTATKEFLAIEFKRTQDARSNYVERATAVAQEQYKSLLAGLQAAGQVKEDGASGSWPIDQLSTQWGAWKLVFFLFFFLFFHYFLWFC